MFDFDKNGGVTKNTFLVKSVYYDRLAIYNFLVMARQKYNKSMVRWSMIYVCVNYDRGV